MLFKLKEVAVAEKDKMIIEIEALLNKNLLNQTNELIDHIGKQAKKTEKTITDSFGGAFKKVAGLAATYLTFDLIKDGIGMASDFTENRNKLEQVFQGQIEDTDKFINSMASSLNLGKRQVEREMADVGAMIKGMGFEGEDLQTNTQAVIKMAKDIASFYNTDLQDAIYKVSSGLTGETEALKALGINIQDAEMEEFANKQGLVWNQLDNTSKSYLRLIAIQEKLKQSGATGDAERTKNEYASLERSIKSLSETIMGDFFSATKDALVPMLQEVVGFLQNNQDEIVGLGTKLGELTSTVVQGVLAFGEFVSTNWEVISIVGGLISVLGVGLGVYQTVVGVTKAWKDAQVALNVAMTLNPIGATIAAIAALGYAGYLAYQKFEWFRNGVNAVWDTLKGMWNWLKESKLGKIVGSILGSGDEVAEKVNKTDAETTLKTNEGQNKSLESVLPGVDMENSIKKVYKQNESLNSYNFENITNKNITSENLTETKELVHKFEVNVNSQDEELNSKLSERMQIVAQETIEEHERNRKLSYGIT